MLNKTIEFTLTEPLLKNVAELPSPSLNNLPEWYKNMPSYINKEKKYNDGGINETMKKCMPILDSMNNGYLIKTWTEVHFSGSEVTWSVQNSSMKAVDGHSIDQVPGYPISSYYKKNIYKWINPWKIKTPKGYSTLFLTPIGHHLPFKIIEGVVDTDTFPLTINFPFLLKSDFEGVVPHNTPIVQAIPFKRDSFKSVEKNFDETYYEKVKNFHNRTFSNKYKINWWTRKEFK